MRGRTRTSISIFAEKCDKLRIYTLYNHLEVFWKLATLQALLQTIQSSIPRHTPCSFSHPTPCSFPSSIPRPTSCSFSRSTPHPTPISTHKHNPLSTPRFTLCSTAWLHIGYIFSSPRSSPPSTPRSSSHSTLCLLHAFPRLLLHIFSALYSTVVLCESISLFMFHSTLHFTLLSNSYSTIYSMIYSISTPLPNQCAWPCSTPRSTQRSTPR